jgi:hypothetical protein
MTKQEIENEIKRSLSVDVCEQILSEDSVSEDIKLKVDRILWFIDEGERILIGYPNEKLREAYEKDLEECYKTLVDLAMEELRKQGKIDLALEEWRKHVEL